ncbi:MAG: type II secretion system protein [Thermodesulfobacteriota bacterium]
MRRPCVSQSGFTLLEVLVAVVILGLAYVAILQSFSHSTLSILRLAKKRGSVLSSAQAFERDTQTTTQGELFLEGHRFKLRRVTSDDGRLETLRLVKE